jgi:glycosyltransferase involved in cell wall biosynthesis
VEFVGEVDDPERLYQRAGVFVEATTSGGGTKLKILNAMARGLPVVASQEAVEGLSTLHGDNVLTGSGDASIASAIINVLGDRALWERLSSGGRALIRDKYLAEVAFAPLDDALRAASARTPSG